MIEIALLLKNKLDLESVEIRCKTEEITRFMVRYRPIDCLLKATSVRFRQVLIVVRVLQSTNFISTGIIIT